VAGGADRNGVPVIEGKRLLPPSGKKEGKKKSREYYVPGIEKLTLYSA